MGNALNGACGDREKPISVSIAESFFGGQPASPRSGIISVMSVQIERLQAENELLKQNEHSSEKASQRIEDLEKLNVQIRLEAQERENLQIRATAALQAEIERLLTQKSSPDETNLHAALLENETLKVQIEGLKNEKNMLRMDLQRARNDASDSSRTATPSLIKSKPIRSHKRQDIWDSVYVGNSSRGSPILSP